MCTLALSTDGSGSNEATAPKSTADMQTMGPKLFTMKKDEGFWPPSRVRAGKIQERPESKAVLRQ